MLEKKYLIEYLGVLVAVTAKLLTEGNPFVMGIIYFSIFFIAQGITTGYFTPFGPIAMYMVGRTTMQDAIMNIGVQFMGALSAGILFRPIQSFVE